MDDKARRGFVASGLVGLLPADPERVRASRKAPSMPVVFTRAVRPYDWEAPSPTTRLFPIVLIGSLPR
jgi:hypothetical protein